MILKTIAPSLIGVLLVGCGNRASEKKPVSDRDVTGSGQQANLSGEYPILSALANELSAQARSFCPQASAKLEPESVVGPDTESPEVTEIALGKDSYAPGEKVSLLFRATDNFSGLSNLSVWSYRNEANKDWDIATGGLNVGIFALPDGSFCTGDATISNFAVAGKYKIETFSIYDHAGNQTVYRADENQEFYTEEKEGEEPKPTSMKVISFEFSYDQK